MTYDPSVTGFDADSPSPWNPSSAHEEAHELVGLPSHVQTKLGAITDPTQRRILLGCLERGETIPDFAWRPLTALGEKMAALHSAVEELPLSESFALALSSLPPGVQCLVEDSCTFGGDECPGDPTAGSSGRWENILTQVFLGAFHATARGLLARPPQPFGFDLRRACGVNVALGAILLGAFVEAAEESLQHLSEAGTPEETRIPQSVLNSLGGLLGFAESTDWPGPHPPADPARRFAYFVRVTVGLGVDLAANADCTLTRALRENWGDQSPTNRFLFEHLMPADQAERDGPGPEEHLLVRYVHFNYPRTPGEGAVLAELVAERLRVFGAAATAAVRNLPLEDWIEYAAGAGEHVAGEHPALAAALEREIGEEACAGNMRVWRGFFLPEGQPPNVAPEPGSAAFTRAVLDWWEERFPARWRQSPYLPDRCEQIRVLVDCAFWMALLRTKG